MAALNYTPIQLYRSTTPAAIPLAVNLIAGELALNIADGKLYYNDSGVVKLLASSASTTSVNTLSFGTTGLTPSTSTSGAITVAGTLATTNGGTGLTTFASTGVFYAGSSSAVSQSPNFTFNGTTLTANTIGAFTLGGTIAGGGNQINDVIIGTSTPLAGFFTALSYNSTLTGGTGIVNLGSGQFYKDTSGNIGIGTISPTSTLQAVGTSAKSAIKTPNIAEVDTISAIAATGVINYDITTQSVLFYTTNASGNWTVNFRGSSGTTLDAVMQIGESISATFLVTQGATAYYNSAVTIDGSSVTPKWQGGTAPTSGNINAVDCYTYVIQKTGSATYAVLASQTKFA